EAEEDAAAGGGLGDGERARRAELVVEGHGADLVGVVRRLRRPRDPTSQLARRLAGEVRLAVAEVLRHCRDALGHDAVVVPFPAGVLVEGFALEVRLRWGGGPAVACAASERDESQAKEAHRGPPRGHGMPEDASHGNGPRWVA